MELRQLEYFVAVAEERHFTRAAERLLVSQSGLSAAVRSLERELGARLFVRTTRAVELTAAGQALLTEALRALRSAHAAKEAVAEVQGLLRGRLSVGTEQCVAGVDVPALLARFRAEHPQVEIRLQQADSATLVTQLTAGRLDLAFVAATGEPPPDVRLMPLTSEPMVLLCHSDHALAGVSSVTWAQLSGEPFVDFHPTWGARQLTDRAFQAAGAKRQVSLEVNDVHTLIDLVTHGLGIAVVPRPVARKPQAATLSTLSVTGTEPAEPGSSRWRSHGATPSPPPPAGCSRTCRARLRMVREARPCPRPRHHRNAGMNAPGRTDPPATADAPATAGPPRRLITDWRFVTPPLAIVVLAASWGRDLPAHFSSSQPTPDTRAALRAGAAEPCPVAVPVTGGQFGTTTLQGASCVDSCYQDIQRL